MLGYHDEENGGGGEQVDLPALVRSLGMDLRSHIGLRS